MKKEKKIQKIDSYYLGLDIGTDSVGYAVTDTTSEYKIPKFNRNPMWGVMLFDEAEPKQNRRAFRTARRRLDRRQRRIKLLQGLFAKEIAKKDERFFKRIKESALYTEDRMDPYCLFNDESYTDVQYHKDYPTIHHLISELIKNPSPHDSRLVYLACAWLIAHRGHFLSNISEDHIEEGLKFEIVYDEMIDYLRSIDVPDSYLDVWVNADKELLGNALAKKTRITNKQKDIAEAIYGARKPPKKVNPEEGLQINMEGLIKLLSGGKISLKDLFGNESYDDLGSISVNEEDEKIEAVISTLGDDGELIRIAKSIYDWSLLRQLIGEGGTLISDAKIHVYNQHKEDLKFLKMFVRKYIPEKYDEIFNDTNPEIDNYVAYSGNIKGSKGNLSEKKKNIKNKPKEKFYDYLRKQIKDIVPEDADKEDYDKMLGAIETGSFLPKQVDGDNRVLPYQLYYVELKKILENASKYISFLNEKDADGYSGTDKILSLMKFRVPYFVGPLNSTEYGWAVLKEGKTAETVLPWNFEKMVDFDKSEDGFIKKMLNSCTYLPEEDVLPKQSLLYQKFEVLNEINNIKIQGNEIDVCIKQSIYEKLFSIKKKVTPKDIKEYLVANDFCQQQDADTISGIDETIKSSLSSAIQFKRLFESKAITRSDAERIIERRTFTEDKSRFVKWLNKEYSHLKKEDIDYLSRLKFTDFGRLSEKLLCGITGTNVETGETGTVMHFLWETNDNLSNILLSDNYTFKEDIEEENRAYFKKNPRTLDARLDDMRVSNTVKRQIYRTMDVVNDVTKAIGKAPKKVFVEMARGGKPEQKGKRTQSRKDQLIELYKNIDNEDVRYLQKQLEEMGDRAETMLQSESLFLYYTQLGKCMYSGEPINVAKLKDGTYNIDHIYPQSRVKDDSILNNKVLVKSEINFSKQNDIVNSSIRHSMRPYWEMLRQNGLITEEKFNRLTRSKPFTDDEKWGFINRQLVETRQSTKVIAEILKERFPDSEIVYVKAGLVSDFRKEYNLLKSRSVNDLHHAKDAYLNIVCGNVYNEHFTRQWFNENKDSDYTVKMNIIFKFTMQNQGKCFWKGEESLNAVQKTMAGNQIHMVPFSFLRTRGQSGGLFNQMPEKAKEGLIARKAGLDPAKYGGYNNSTSAGFVIVKYTLKGKDEIAIVPLDLMYLERCRKNSAFMLEHVESVLNGLLGKPASSVSLPFGNRILGINTLFEVDGLRLCLAGKNSGGKLIGFKVFTSLKLSQGWETYVKKIEKLAERSKNILYDAERDVVDAEKNVILYGILIEKLTRKPYLNRPETNIESISKAIEIFQTLSLFEQVNALLSLISLFSRAVQNNKVIGIGSSCRLSYKIANWNYKDIAIIDQSPAGLWESRSPNLKEL